MKPFAACCLLSIAVGLSGFTVSSVQAGEFSTLIAQQNSKPKPKPSPSPSPDPHEGHPPGHMNH